MSLLEQTVAKYYGKNMVSADNRQYVHHIFSHFQQNQTKSSYFFKLIQLPSSYHISEAITELQYKKYNGFIAPMQIIPVDRNFQNYTYLVKSSQNIISLETYVNVKIQCWENLTAGFLAKLFEFLKNSYNTIKKKEEKLFNYNQIGIMNNGQFIICDPVFYFQQKNQQRQEIDFGPWICNFIENFLGVKSDQQDLNKVLLQKSGQNSSKLIPFFRYLLSGNATPDHVLSRLSTVASRISSEATTVSASYVDLNEITQPILKGDNEIIEKKTVKISIITKIFIFLFILGILAGVGYFVMTFFNRKVLCQQGQYLSENKACVSCSDGCVKCSSGEQDKCMKCNDKMFLVVNYQSDKVGFCLKECKGRLINVGVCLRDRSPNDA